MTLILGMSKADGVYLSADYRVTNSRTGRLIDDASVKHLQVHFPPDQTGPRALLAYTGLAILPDGTPTGTWIRETLRGETEVINASMAHLGDRLERDIAQLRQPLIINMLVVEGQRRFFGGFSNVRKPFTVLPHFEYRMHELTEPAAFANGSGAARVLADRHLAKMDEQRHIKPRKPMDHMNLLAAINRRVAAFEDTVSPYCHVAYLPSNALDQPAARSEIFTKPGESAPFTTPAITNGLDISDMIERFQARVERARSGEDSEFDMTDAFDGLNLQRRP